MTKKYSDAQAKKILRSNWPSRPTSLWGGDRGFVWLRAQPVNGREKGPRLRSAGAAVFNTQPDGMWVRLVPPDFADVMVFEVCGSQQNFFDKRSRYAPSNTATTLAVARHWLKGTLPIQGGGQAVRWESVGYFNSPPVSDLLLPVRTLRVLYFLPEALYARWREACAPGAHEFFAPQSSMRSFTAQKMQAFLARMEHDAHFYAG